MCLRENLGFPSAMFVSVRLRRRELVHWKYLRRILTELVGNNELIWKDVDITVILA